MLEGTSCWVSETKGTDRRVFPFKDFLSSGSSVRVRTRIGSFLMPRFRPFVERSLPSGLGGTHPLRSMSHFRVSLPRPSHREPYHRPLRLPLRGSTPPVVSPLFFPTPFLPHSFLVSRRRRGYPGALPGSRLVRIWIPNHVRVKW